MISIIIPVYNVKKYLRQCLDSVVCQSYKNIEILIVDDGSTDGSGDICDEYKKDGRVRVFHTENRGLSAARNYALDQSSGEYIAFLDSDDWLEETALECFISVAQNANADIVACRFYQEFSDITIEPKGIEIDFTIEGDEILKTMVIDHKITEDVWNKFYRANLFKTIRYPEGRIFEDKATTYKLLQKASILVYTPAKLIHYRNREGSLSNVHSMKSLVDYWIVYRERFDRLGSISQEYYVSSLSEAVSAISRMWRWYAGCTEQEKREARSYLGDMQQFINAYGKEILSGPYSRHVKATCYYARTQNPLMFKLLYLMNTLYRSRNKNKYFEQ